MFWDLKTEIVCLRAGAPGLCRYRCGGGGGDGWVRWVVMRDPGGWSHRTKHYDET